MRALFLAVVIIALAVWWYEKHHEEPTLPAESKTSASHPTISPPTQPSPPSEVNWMKRSLDRANDVAKKSRAQTAESQDP
jgi:hypothetical protein